MTDAEAWAKGSMTFTNKWAMPPNMSMSRWLLADDGRKWVSKSGEPPATFIARVLRDLEKDGAQITDYLLDEIKKFHK